MGAFGHKTNITVYNFTALSNNLHPSLGKLFLKPGLAR